MYRSTELMEITEGEWQTIIRLGTIECRVERVSRGDNHYYLESQHYDLRSLSRNTVLGLVRTDPEAFELVLMSP